MTEAERLEYDGKLGPLNEGEPGQVLTEASGGAMWADMKETPAGNPALFTIEQKSQAKAGVYEADLGGGQIQKWPVTAAASDSAEISLEGLSGVMAGAVTAVEMQIPVASDVSVITYPSGLQAIMMPDTLSGWSGEEKRDRMTYMYHDIIVKAEKGANGAPKALVEYSYAFSETVPGDTRDYFCIEPAEDNATVICEKFKASYGLSSSLDRVTWTALTGETVATGLSAGQKVYLIGDTGTLDAQSWSPGCRFTSDKKFKAKGRIFSLYSDMLKPKKLTNTNEPNRFFFNNQNLIECGVDFSPTERGAYCFATSRSLSVIASGFNWRSAVTAQSMFNGCYILSSFPDDFTFPNVTNTDAMFYSCTNLSSLPDGFSTPRATNTGSMFNGCTKLSNLPSRLQLP